MPGVFRSTAFRSPARCLVGAHLLALAAISPAAAQVMQDDFAVTIRPTPGQPISGGVSTDVYITPDQQKDIRGPLGQPGVRPWPLTPPAAPYSPYANRPPSPSGARPPPLTGSIGTSPPNVPPGSPYRPTPTLQPRVPALATPAPPQNTPQGSSPQRVYVGTTPEGYTKCCTGSDMDCFRAANVWGLPACTSTSSNAPSNTPANTPQRTQPPSPPLLQGSLEAINDAIDKVPGLPQILQTGAQITQAEAQAMADQWTKTNDSGIKMAFGALIDEYTGQAFHTARDGIVTQMANAISDDDIVKKFTTLLNPERLSKLKGVRGANPSFNRIMYWVYMSERKGLDTTAVLKDVLAKHNISGPAADLIIYNLKDSYQLGKQVDVFTAANILKLRFGFSAKMGPLMGNNGNFDIGHIIDANGVPELGKTIANLKWEWSGVNRAYKDQLSPQAVNWARKMYNAGLIDNAVLNKVVAEAQRRMQ